MSIYQLPDSDQFMVSPLFSALPDRPPATKRKERSTDTTLIDRFHNLFTSTSLEYLTSLHPLFHFTYSLKRIFLL